MREAVDGRSRTPDWLGQTGGIAAERFEVPASPVRERKRSCGTPAR